MVSYNVAFHTCLVEVHNETTTTTTSSNTIITTISTTTITTTSTTTTPNLASVVSYNVAFHTCVVSISNGFLHSRFSMYMWYPDDIGRDSWVWAEQ